MAEYDDGLDADAYEPDDDTLAEWAREGRKRRAEVDDLRARKAAQASRGRPVLVIRCPGGDKAGEVRATRQYGLVLINTGRRSEPAIRLDSLVEMEGAVLVKVTCRCGTRLVSVDQIRQHREMGKAGDLILRD